MRKIAPEDVKRLEGHIAEQEKAGKPTLVFIEIMGINPTPEFRQIFPDAFINAINGKRFPAIPINDLNLSRFTNFESDFKYLIPADEIMKSLKGNPEAEAWFRSVIEKKAQEKGLKKRFVSLNTVVNILSKINPRLADLIRKKYIKDVEGQAEDNFGLSIDDEVFKTMLID